MTIGVGLSLWRAALGGAGAGGFSVGNQSVEFGALTLAGAGAAIPTYSGAPVTPTWSIQSGNTGSIYQINSSTGALSTVGAGTAANRTLVCRCVSDGVNFDFTWTVVASGTDANGNNLAVSRSVNNIVELEAAIEAASLAYGDRILMRSGTYGDPATDTRMRPAVGAPVGTFTAPTNLSGTIDVNGTVHYVRGPDMTTGNYVVITKHVGATPVIARVSLDGSSETKGGFLFKDIKFYAASASDLSSSIRNAQGIVNLLNDIKNVAFYGCTFHSTDAASSGFGYKCYTGITTGTGSDFSGFKVIDCTFYDLWNSIVSSDRMDTCDIIGNYCYRAWNDHIKIVGGDNLRICWNRLTDKRVSHKLLTVVGITRGATTTIEFAAGEIAAIGTVNAGDDITFVGVGGTTQLNGNTYNIDSTTGDTVTISVNSTGYGAYTSGGTGKWVEAHGDFLQARTVGYSFDNWLICGNRAWRGSSDAALSDGQGFFSPSDGTGAEEITNVHGIFNIYQGTFVNGFSLTRAVDPIIRGNTIINDRELGQGLATNISFDNGSGAICEDNITNAAIVYDTHVAASSTNNYAASSTLTSGATSYEELFVNYASGSGMTDPAAQLDLDPAGAAYALDPKAGAWSGYVDYDARTITAPHLSGITPGIAFIAGAFSNSGTDPTDHTVNIGTAGSRTIIVCVGNEGAATQSSVIVDPSGENVTLTQVAVISGTSHQTAIYKGTVTGGGSKVVRVDFSVAATNSAIAVYEVTGTLSNETVFTGGASANATPPVTSSNTVPSNGVLIGSYMSRIATAAGTYTRSDAQAVTKDYDAVTAGATGSCLAAVSSAFSGTTTLTVGNGAIAAHSVVAVAWTVS